MSGTSGLPRAKRQSAHAIAVHAAQLALHHKDSVHYTQGILRWEGIAHKRVAVAGHYPHHADCSSFVTWCLWNALGHHYHLPDNVNGQAWQAGYTGTLLQHGKQVHSEKHVLRGDAVIYGNGWPGEHTALCVGGGMVISFGSEPGPFLLPIHYRSDVMEIRRYI